MTPRTRSTNKEATFKTYYSKKVPQQAHFPHRRKVVRRRDTPERDEPEKRQMKFLPEKMRVRNDGVVEDSDEGSDMELDMEDGEVSIKKEVEDEERPVRVGSSNKESKKRASDVVQREPEQGDEPALPTSKRRRRTAASREDRHSKQIESETEDEAVARKEPSRKLRRQSTMTQIVDGRRPHPDAEEPEFQPINRSLRRSSSGKGKKKEQDKKQRTLTQMIPGFTPLGDSSEAELEAELAQLDALDAQSEEGWGNDGKKTNQFALQGEAGNVNSQPLSMPDVQMLVDGKDDHEELPTLQPEVPSVVVHSVEDSVDEDSYESTQFIDAPATRTRQSPRQPRQEQAGKPQLSEVDEVQPSRVRRPRFSLLSTPEKRRVREIPSSQSPPESPLFTQISPRKMHRSLPQQRCSNPKQTADPPSRRKQVIFQEPSRKQVVPPSLRRFESTIQDSEDDSDELIEGDISDEGKLIGAHTQALIHGMDNPKHDKAVGAHTQAILDQIDQACAVADQNSDRCRDPSEESSRSKAPRTSYVTSPELGEQAEQVAIETTEDIGIKQELHRNIDSDDLPIAGISSSHERHMDDIAPAAIETQFSVLPEHLRSSPPLNLILDDSIIPSTPMKLEDELPNDEPQPGPAPPPVVGQSLQHTSSTFAQPSLDLDGYPINTPRVRVARSPTSQHETQDSQSSKAERQIQNEWQSYSQMLNTRPPQPSATNLASRHAPPLPPQFSGHQLSQATTVDELTPKKNRTQVPASANTTPHKIAGSQLFSSPNKPPPLFIPSSFPSPTKSRVGEWSSPVFGRTQDFRSSQFAASLDDFSIPPLPPPVDDIDNDDED